MTKEYGVTGAAANTLGIAVDPTYNAARERTGDDPREVGILVRELSWGPASARRIHSLARRTNATAAHLAERSARQRGVLVGQNQLAAFGFHVHARACACFNHRPDMRK